MDILVIDQQPAGTVIWNRLADQEGLSCQHVTHWEAGQNTPDSFIVVLDKSTVRENLEGAVREISQAAPRAIIIVTCDDLGVDLAMRLMRTGALYVLRKPLDSEQLHRELVEIRQRLGTLKRERAEFEDLHKLFANLTEREQDVLHYVLQGVSNKNAATSLEVSVRTIEARRAKVYQKTGSSHVVELVRKVDRYRQLSSIFAPHKMLYFDSGKANKAEAENDSNWTSPSASSLKAI